MQAVALGQCSVGVEVPGLLGLQVIDRVTQLWHHEGQHQDAEGITKRAKVKIEAYCATIM